MGWVSILGGFRVRDAQVGTDETTACFRFEFCRAKRMLDRWAAGNGLMTPGWFVSLCFHSLSHIAILSHAIQDSPTVKRFFSFAPTSVGGNVTHFGKSASGRAPQNSS
jgi:hypothetical protein